MSATEYKGTRIGCGGRAQVYNHTEWPDWVVKTYDSVDQWKRSALVYLKAFELGVGHLLAPTLFPEPGVMFQRRVNVTEGYEQCDTFNELFRAIPPLEYDYHAYNMGSLHGQVVLIDFEVHHNWDTDGLDDDILDCPDEDLQILIDCAKLKITNPLNY